MTSNSMALVPQILSSGKYFQNPRTISFQGIEVLCVGLGVLVLSALAQVVIPLPWTPVPITGQTLGVTLVALLWGRRLAFATLGTYLLLGGLGLPIFAAGKSGLLVGPTLGYLLGMWLASWVVGGFADRGYATSFWKCFGISLLGSICTFSCGLFVLSFFVPSSALL